MPTQRVNSPVYCFVKQGCTTKDFSHLSDLCRPNEDHLLVAVPPAGIEPAHQPPEGCALSPELRGRMHKVISACANRSEVPELSHERTDCIFRNRMFLGC